MRPLSEKTIALLTDFGLSDNFVGVMKGVILAVNPRVHLVDISHAVNPQDIVEGALLLKSSYAYFPKGSIFLVVIDPGVGSRRKPAIIKTHNYVFVGPDNGVLSIAAQEDRIQEVRCIENEKYFMRPVSNTFHGRDIFAPTAAYLSKGVKHSQFGKVLKSMKKINIQKPTITKHRVGGKVIYIDRFGNLITNISKGILERFTQYRKCTAQIENVRIPSMVDSYQAVKYGKPLAIVGSFGFLEISVNGGSAEKYFKADKNTRVDIIHG